MPEPRTGATSLAETVCEIVDRHLSDNPDGHLTSDQLKGILIEVVEAVRSPMREVVADLRKDAAENQPSQRMDSWDCADFIERKVNDA